MRKNSRMMRLYLKRAAAAAVAAALTVTLACTAPSGRAFAEENAAVKSGAAGESQPGLENKEKKAEKDQKNSKEESVYVIADASGAAKKIIVSDWLKILKPEKALRMFRTWMGLKISKGTRFLLQERIMPSPGMQKGRISIIRELQKGNCLLQ